MSNNKPVTTEVAEKAEPKLTKKQLHNPQRNDAERIYVERYVAERKAAGKPPILRFVLRSGKPLAGVLVELGTYCYIVDVKVEEKPTRVILYKHSVDYVLLGEA